MKLELTQKLQQQQILAPQMILSMDILLLPTLDLEQRIQEEFSENPALELVETKPQAEAPALPTNTVEGAAQKTESFDKVHEFGSQPSQFYDGSPRRRTGGDPNTKHEALQNTQGKPPGLRETLSTQLRLRNFSKRVQIVANEIINNLDHRGYMLSAPEELCESLGIDATHDEFWESYEAVRSLDPAGVGAVDLRDCLLLQLDRDPQEYPIETKIIESHLDDLAMNKIPKIAKDLGCSVEDVKDAVEIISMLDPFPGGRLESEQTIYVKADVSVEEVDGELVVHVENSSIPSLEVSDSCRSALKQSKGDQETSSFLRKKIESAQWLIQAIQQRQRTIQDIAVALVDYQREFMLEGPDKLRALKMQTLADLVNVHLSTISRAIKGKYIQTPHGLFEMRYFFTGGVDNADCEVESRRNIYRQIHDIIDAENKAKPLSDTAIAKKLQENGLKIARRTVTKYREQEGIPSSRLRKVY